MKINAWLGFGVLFFFVIFFLVFLFSGTSSHKFTQHIHTHTHKLSQVQRLNPPPHAGRRISRRAEKRWPPGGGAEGRDAPSNQAPDACIIPWRGRGRGEEGRSPCVQPAPAGQRCVGKGGEGAEQGGWVGLQDWLITWRGMRSRPAGLLALANPHRGRLSPRHGGHK